MAIISKLSIEDTINRKCIECFGSYKDAEVYVSSLIASALNLTKVNAIVVIDDDICNNREQDDGSFLSDIYLWRKDD